MFSFQVCSQKINDASSTETIKQENGGQTDTASSKYDNFSKFKCSIQACYIKAHMAPEYLGGKKISAADPIRIFLVKNCNVQPYQDDTWRRSWALTWQLGWEGKEKVSRSFCNLASFERQHGINFSQG